MREFKIDFNKTFKPFLLAYVCIFVIGIIIAAIFGVNLDTNFAGGTQITYSYSGELKVDDFEKEIDKVLDKDFTLTESTSVAGDTKTLEIELIGKNALSIDDQQELTSALQAKFKDNKIDVYGSNSASATLAGTFFVRSMVAVLLCAILVVIYVGIRFRKIGGISAALTALVALVFDVLLSFFVCVFFGLQIDDNYIAVVLTLLGYSLNDTIVIYDRIRENRRLYPEKEIGDVVNMSVNKVIIRNIVTTITTIAAVVTIIVVAELYGITTLRTLAIPMAFGLISGSVSSIFISGPLWVIWKRYKQKKTKK